MPKKTILGNVRCLALLLACMASACQARSEPPNIVYILADDMGHGDVKALAPQGLIPTPNLDRLAREGMAFTQAYSGSSVCTPTRYGLMTGRYPWREKVALASNYGSRIMPENQRTVASFLHDQDYKTIMVGKWHLGTSWKLKDDSVMPDRTNLKFRGKISKDDIQDTDIDFSAPFFGGPTDHGFDYWYGISGSLDFAPYVYLENNRVTKTPTERLTGKHRFGFRSGLADPDLRPTAVLGDFTRKAVSLIEKQNKDEPFFLYMPLNAPHSPVAPSKDFQGKSGLDKHADFRIEIDWSVGRILGALDRQGLSDNTIVIFTADNGTYPGASKSLPALGHDTHDGRSGEKATLFEGGHRVPFIVRWPDGIRGETDRRDTGNITLEDFIATMADILDRPVPGYAVDSLSFLPQLQGKAPADERDVIVSSLSNILIGRQGHWKLVYQSPAEMAARSQGNPLSKDLAKGLLKPADNAPWHQQVSLYDLRKDVKEQSNVAAQYPERVALINRGVRAAITNGRSTQGSAQAPDKRYALSQDQLRRIDLLENLQAPGPQ